MGNIAEMLDAKLGNATPSVTIAEALGYPDMPIDEALDMYESAELTPREDPEPVVTTYTVSYNANGGEGTVESVEVTAGESITLDDGSGLTPPEDKEFLGWAETALAPSPTVESPFTPNKDIELFAVWGDSEPVVTTYTVSYNANGGTGTISSDTVNAGSSVTLPDGSGLTPPEGKEFLGWAKSSSAQSPTVESPFTPDKDTELYAVYGDL